MSRRPVRSSRPNRPPPATRNREGRPGHATPTPEQAGSAEPSTDPGRPVLSAEEERKAQATRIAARIQAAIVFVNQQSPKTIVLLGHGSGAYWAVQALSDSSSSGIDNLVLVEAEVPGYGPPLEESAPKLKQAIGDFFYQDKPLDSAAALKRLQASKRDKHPAYVQVGLKSLPIATRTRSSCSGGCAAGWTPICRLRASGRRRPHRRPSSRSRPVSDSAETVTLADQAVGVVQLAGLLGGLAHPLRAGPAPASLSGWFWLMRRR